MSERAWLKNYNGGVAHTLWPYPNKTLVDVLSESAHQRLDYPARFFNGARMSYQRFEDLSNAFACSLIDLIVKKGTRLPCCFRIARSSLFAR